LPRIDLTTLPLSMPIRGSLPRSSLREYYIFSSPKMGYFDDAGLSRKESDLAYHMPLTSCSFQAYTSCTVVLQAIAQKQLHGFPREEWEEDLESAAQCLSILKFCGTSDPVALRFHGILAYIYERLCAHSPNPSTSSRPPLNGYLLTIPPDGSEDHVRLSLTLMIMLCRPFGDPDNQEHAEANMKTCERINPSRYEVSQLVERLEWDFERKSPFQRDIERLGLKYDNGILQRLAELNRSRGWFLGSTQPSGWSFSPELPCWLGEQGSRPT
jgi:hypothetical protein